ncbi:MAG: glycosyltransferase, partial [Chitinophagaceae bacterium]|nr:glycosyltransferase [Chitinophagaceae bacterium]
MSPDISIIVPLYNEDESLPELVSWIDKVCREHHYRYEVIMVDDGS